jgi:hypothetical protein
MYPPMRCALAKVTEVHHNAQANPCGSSLRTRRLCLQQLACIGVWRVRVGVGVFFRRHFLTQGLFVCAQNLLPPASAVLSSRILRPGLLSARRTRLQTGIFRPALRWAGPPSGVLRPRLLSARRTCLRKRSRPALRWAGLPAGGCAGLPGGRPSVRTTRSDLLLPPRSPLAAYRKVPGEAPVAKVPQRDHASFPSAPA